MALRYLVLASRGGDLAREKLDSIVQKTGLFSQNCSARLAVLTSDSRAPHCIGDGAGSIIGDLFHRNGAQSAVKYLDAEASMTLASATAQQLLKYYWGGYLAVWTEGNRIQVLRDPSGHMPCFYVVGPSIVAFSSDPRLLIDAGLISVLIDWKAVATNLYVDDLAQIRTCLMGVSDLLAGNLATVSASGCSQNICWSPWQHVQVRPELDPDAHIERLRGAVEQCSRGWASSFDKGVLAVSGGLDSSILAACMAETPDLKCLTLHTNEPRGDETIYARELCESLSLPLTNRSYRLDLADILRSAVAHLPSPGSWTQMVAYNAAVTQEMTSRAATIFMNGAGGDNVFYLTHSVRPVVDRYLSTGFTSGLVATLRDIAQITEASVWEVVRRAVAIPRRRGPKYGWRFERQFLHPNWLEQLEAEKPSHAWLEAPAEALPGKCGHVAMITRAQHYQHGYDRRLPFTAISPLLSQPVVETALAIPTWVACEGGVDRSAARRAFASDLPQNIVRRRMKGGPDAFAIEILKANYNLVRDRLLGGNLVANRIVSKAEIETTLVKDRFSHGTNYVRLLLLLDTEAWIEGWQADRAIKCVTSR
jgi:asparagine synthase (glutamine-hydrolysing)